MSTEDQPDYVSALHLHSLPFESGTDSEVFFADGTLTQRLDQIQHLAQFGGLILVVEGEAGSGKTTFLKELVNRAGDGWKVCRIQGDVNFAPVEVIRQIARQFDLDDGGHPDDLGRTIFDFCQVMGQTSQVPVILVDDADRMPLAVFGQMLAIGGSSEETLRQLRIVLFGTPGLQDNLVKAGVCDDASLIHSVIMHPLDEAQTDAYMVYRLSMAGFSGASPFSSMEVRAIHKSGAGLPLRINRLAHQTLLEHVWAVPRQAQGQRQGAPFYRKLIPDNLSGEGKWLAAGVTAVLIAGILWLVGPEPETDKFDEAEGMLSEQLALPASDAPLPEAELEDVRQTRAEPKELETRLQGSDVAQATKDPGEKEQLPLLLPVPARPEAPASVVVADAPVAPASAESSVAAAMVEPDAIAEDPEETATVTELPPVPAPASVVPEPRKQLATPPETQQVAKVSNQGEVVAPPGSDTPDVRGENWLLNQSPEAVTLQLLGVSREASLKRFLKEHPFPGPTAYFHTFRNGKPWYVLVHGVYPDRDTAKAAIASLPEGLRTGNPWPRTFASIQTDIQPTSSR